MTLRDDLLPLVNHLRQLPTQFGIRLYTPSVRITQWTGSDMPGQGTPTTIETILYLDGYGTLPKCSEISCADIIASGGLYSDGDWSIDFMTPKYYTYDSAGILINIFEPEQSNIPTEINYVITGPDFPNGTLFKKIKSHTDKPFTYKIILRKIGVNS
jgi:hypothetical protein